MQNNKVNVVIEELNTEVQLIKKDISYLKDSMDKMIPKFENMYETFIKGEGKINVLNKTVFGNGKIGLKDKIDLKAEKIEINEIQKRLNKLDEKFAKYAGGLAVVVTIITILANVLF